MAGTDGGYRGRGAGRWGALAATLGLGMLAGCGGEMSVIHRPVSSDTMARLESKSESRTDLALKRTRTGWLANGSWEAQDAVTVPMNLSLGVPRVRAKINGQPVKLIVDTGSQGTVLEADTALRCGVRTLRRGDGGFTLSGISGSEDALLGMPDHAEIGGWSWSGLPCFIRVHESALVENTLFGERRFPMNVLGMDLMRMCSYVTLDYVDEKVTFGFAGAYALEDGIRRWKVPFQMKDGLPTVRVGSGKAVWDAVIDSGSSGCLEINRGVASSLGKGLAVANQASGFIRMGLGSQRPQESEGVKVARLAELERLGPRLMNVPVYIVPDCSKIGSGLLAPFRVTLDFKRSVIWLEAPRG